MRIYDQHTTKVSFHIYLKNTPGENAFLDVISSGLVHGRTVASATEEAASIISSEFNSQKEARILKRE